MILGHHRVLKDIRHKGPSTFSRYQRADGPVRSARGWMAPSAAFITTQVADMTAAPLAEELGGQQCEQSLQRRNLLRAGQTGLADGLGQVEVEHQGKEQEETGDLSGELPSVFEGQRPDIGEVGHEGTVVGVSTRLPQGTTLASRGQAGAAQDPEEIRFADVEPFALERGVNVCQGGSLAAEFAGLLVDGITFRGCLGAGPRAYAPLFPGFSGVFMENITESYNVT